MVPAVVGASGKIVSAKVATVTGVGSTLLKATPIIGPVVIGAGKLSATVAIALKAATAIVGVGKLSLLPVLIASLVYYNYDFFDPENRPFNVKQIDPEYGWFFLRICSFSKETHLEFVLFLTHFFDSNFSSLKKNKEDCIEKKLILKKKTFMLATWNW